MLLLCALGLWIGCGIRLCISTAATQEPPPPLGDASHDWHLSSDELLHQAVLERLFDPVAGPGRVQQTREALGLGLHGAEEGKDEDWDWEEERDDDPRGPRGPWVLEGGDGKDRRINRGGTTSTTAATPHLIQGMSAGEAAADGSAEDPPVQFGKGATDQHSLRTLALYQQLQEQVRSERSAVARDGGGGGSSQRSQRSEARRPERLLFNASSRSCELGGTAGHDWSERDGKRQQQQQQLGECMATAGTREASVWPVACDERMWSRDSAYGIIAGCSPGVAATTRHGIAAGRQCSRRVRDGFASAEECAALIVAADRAMDGLFHQGDQTSIACVRMLWILLLEC